MTCAVVFSAKWRGETRPVGHATLVELFESQVEAVPDAIAIAQDKRCLNYRELNTAADQLARRLIDRGVCARAW